MVIKKIETRDYLRTFITKVNKEAGFIYNASKLNSIKECEDYLLNLVKNLRHNKQDNKAYIKEIDSLKEEIEILNTGNKRLESERAFYITQAEEAGILIAVKKHLNDGYEYRDIECYRKSKINKEAKPINDIVLSKIYRLGYLRYWNYRTSKEVR